MHFSANRVMAVLLVFALALATAIGADAARRGGPGPSGRPAVRTVHRAPSHGTVHHGARAKHHAAGKEISGRAKDRRALSALPISKPVVGDAFRKGKLSVPQDLHPKLSLARRPPSQYRRRFAPFIQRAWKKPFFWVTIAGIGYLTLPELYWDDFYACMGVDDPPYDDCIYILAYAALDEEDVVRVSMPPGVAYRYQAKVAAPEDCRACRWDRFVERKWKQSFGWVMLPEVGNLTVPDAYYDRFHTFLVSDPPDYPRACGVLQDAAAAEGEGETARLSMPAGTEYRYRAETPPARDCIACTLAPFVDRKWNSAYVWVQVPQTGNVTVPEDAYDRFYRYASAEPPNYAAACKVLTEAAAADTVMTSSLDAPGTE